MNETPCLEHEPGLQALLFGELSPRESDELERHLAECSGCRDALADARSALAALEDVDYPPLPYGDVGTEDAHRAERAWLDFQRRLPVRNAKPRGRRFALELSAMAAVLLIGIALGRFFVSPPRENGVATDLRSAAVGSETIEALERAELLADAGVRYVAGLRSLLGELAVFSVDAPAAYDALITRERAQELIRDGGLLERSLDRERDAAFLRAIGRAELFLEELAALESSPNQRNVRLLQASLRESRLRNELARLDIEHEAQRALEASGWTEDNAPARKDF